jgi:integrase
MFINAAIRDGYMETHHNPYLNFQIKKIPSVRRALEAEQLSALEVLEVPENLELIKDMFLFSCYTGLRYSDMISLKQKDIVRSGEGVYLNIRELKTKKLKQNIPLHVLFGGKAVSIIDKYFNKYRDTVFQNFTDQHINRCLKIIGMMLKLDFPLTFHCSRHTFGTMLAEKTQDPYLIKEMMNHSDLKTSMIYIHSSKKRIENTLKKVDWSL